MTKNRVVFFASGDFAIDTFEMLVRNGSNIVGLVTCNNDKVKYHKRTIREVAEELRIPCYTIKGNEMEEDAFFVDWLKRMKADIFCVISFKKLPKTIIKLAKKCAFNVHASLLPCLRGAAPINWAIRLGYKETGLTAFVLNDKIDQGDIIANTKVKIATGEKYTTLYKKLSDACVDFTEHVINDILEKDDWNDYLIAQPTFSDEFEYVHKATKVNSDYFNCHWTKFTADYFKRLVDSVDDIGFKCGILVKKETENGNTQDVIPCKIYDVEVVDDTDNDSIMICESDGKTFIKIHLSTNTAVLIKKIQIAGKKPMDVADFLNGFRYFREENSDAFITDLMTLKDYYEFND